MCRLIVDRTDTCQYHLMCCMYCIVCRIVLSDLALQQQQAYYWPWLGFFTSITRIAITILYIKAVGDRGGSFSGQGKLHHQLIINTEYIYLYLYLSLSPFFYMLYYSCRVQVHRNLRWPFALLVSHREGRNVLDGNGRGMITNNQLWERIMQHNPYSVTFL